MSKQRIIDQPDDESVFQSSDESLREMDRTDLRIQIVKYRKITTIYDTYITFGLVTDTNRIEFTGTHFEVDRRYSEFEWLHSRLSHAHPYLFVPPLPGKMTITTLDRFADSFLITRQQGLQTFLNRLARHPLLSADPELIAFLSLLKDEFAQYRVTHPSVSTLANMISETRRLVQYRVPNLCEDPASDRSSSEPTDLGVGLIGTKAMKQYEHEFRGYAEETESFLGVAQRMARVTEIVVSNLDGLAYGFEELGRCLSTWPSQLVVELEGRELTTDLNVLAFSDNNQSTSTVPLSAPTQTRGTLQWSHQRPVAPDALTKASHLALEATNELATSLRTTVLAEWKEMASYAQAVRNVFNGRDSLEKSYFDTVEELQNETESVDKKTESRFAALAKSYLPWRQRTPSELAVAACQLQDLLTQSNGQIGAEYNRWRTERSEDTIRNMLKMSQAYSSYWSNVAGAWREAIHVLEQTKYQPQEQRQARSVHSLSAVSSTQITRQPNSFDHRFNSHPPRSVNRLDLENVMDSDEFYLAPAELSPNGGDDGPF
ncbi:Sorting nexin-7 [Fasciola gigantica]|uniref:Sorting nexin-7 n=1 Tax=Fasciola gigantica TaxID=46835 RepID=A0A504YWZ0_FASGI|nr:Sorting nexin-7 [Fasciola gigantica]